MASAAPLYPLSAFTSREPGEGSENSAAADTGAKHFTFPMEAEVNTALAAPEANTCEEGRAGAGTPPPSPERVTTITFADAKQLPLAVARSISNGPTEIEYRRIQRPPEDHSVVEFDIPGHAEPFYWPVEHEGRTCSYAISYNISKPAARPKLSDKFPAEAQRAFNDGLFSKARDADGFYFTYPNPDCDDGRYVLLRDVTLQIWTPSTSLCGPTKQVHSQTLEKWVRVVAQQRDIALPKTINLFIESEYIRQYQERFAAPGTESPKKPSGCCPRASAKIAPIDSAVDPAKAPAAKKADPVTPPRASAAKNSGSPHGSPPDRMAVPKIKRETGPFVRPSQALSIIQPSVARAGSIAMTFRAMASESKDAGSLDLEKAYLERAATGKGPQFSRRGYS